MRWLVGANKENPFNTEIAGQGSTFISHHPKTINEMLHQAGFINTSSFGAGVLDRLTSRLGFANMWIRLSKYLAPSFGKSKIAPWILCKSEAKGNPQLIEAKEISDLLQCPACGGDLSEKKDGYLCLSCEGWYPIEHGIFDFRIRQHADWTYQK